MTIFRHLESFSGKENPDDWLEAYEAAAQAESWENNRKLLCVGLKLRKQAKQWYSTFSSLEKPKTWLEFITMFLEEFGDDDIQASLAECYKIAQRKEKSLKHYLNHFRKYLKKHNTIVKREIAIRYAKYSQTSTDTTKSKAEFEKEEINKISMQEENRVEAFISDLQHYQSHFLITHPKTMQNVKKTTVEIMKWKKWKKS